MKNGMGNSGYAVLTDKGKFLLKLFSNPTFETETAMYSFLSDKISVPKLYFADSEKSLVPHSFTVTEFIEGEPLSEHILKNKNYPVEIAFAVGKMCAVIHEKNTPRTEFSGNRLKLRAYFRKRAIK